MIASRRGTPPRVALVVDHPQRDLAGLVLVAHRLVQAGVVCHLIPLNLREQEVWALEPDLVVLNFLRRGSEAFAERLVEAGIRFALLDTEGAVWTTVDDYAQLLWADAGLRRAARPLCLWGPKLADYLTTHRWFEAEAVRVTGCPRFDFYAPQWRSVLRDPPDAERQRPRILINTNFSISNSRFVTAEQNREQLEGELEWSAGAVEQLVTAERAALAEVFTLVGRLARDFPEADIVLRPHPFERLETYDAAVRAAGNIELSAGGPVQPEILRAAAVIQRSCTTAVEAGMAAIPTFSPQWIPPPVLVPMSEAASVPCASYAELAAMLRDVVDGCYRTPEPARERIASIVHDWFVREDGLAHERVSDALLEELNQTGEVQSQICRRHLYDLHAADGLVGVGKWLRYALRLSPSFSFTRLRRMPPTYWERTDKVFTSNDVGRLLQRIEQAARAQGRLPRPVRAIEARTRGDFRAGYDGYAVTLMPADNGATRHTSL